eukprot:SAG25_NODE_1108_length_3951_cov_1.777259_3_plen_60_part_00
MICQVLVLDGALPSVQLKAARLELAMLRRRGEMRRTGQPLDYRTDEVCELVPPVHNLAR